MGKKPTVFAVKAVNLPLNRETVRGLGRFMAREGTSNHTEACRQIIWRYLVAEGLVERPEDPSTSKTPSA